MEIKSASKGIAPGRDTFETGVKTKRAAVSTSKILSVFCRTNELLWRNVENKRKLTWWSVPVWNGAFRQHISYLLKTSDHLKTSHSESRISGKGLQLRSTSDYPEVVLSRQTCEKKYGMGTHVLSQAQTWKLALGEVLCALYGWIVQVLRQGDTHYLGAIRLYLFFVFLFFFHPIHYLPHIFFSLSFQLVT